MGIRASETLGKSSTSLASRCRDGITARCYCVDSPTGDRRDASKTYNTFQRNTKFSKPAWTDGERCRYAPTRTTLQSRRRAKSCEGTSRKHDCMECSNMALYGNARTRCTVFTYSSVLQTGKSSPTYCSIRLSEHQMA